jgi:hypothetical protein
MAAGSVAFLISVGQLHTPETLVLRASRVKRDFIAHGNGDRGEGAPCGAAEQTGQLVLGLGPLDRYGGNAMSVRLDLSSHPPLSSLTCTMNLCSPLNRTNHII